MNGPEQEGRPADPISQRRTVEIDTLAGVDLRLATERQVVGIFGDQNLRHRRLGRDAALDQAGRCRRLDDETLAGPAVMARRRVTRTRNCAETTSIRSTTSSPMMWSPWRRHAQVLASISTTVSIRGRCAGGEPRLLCRFVARSLISIAFSVPGSSGSVSAAGAKLTDAQTLPASTIGQLPRCGRATLDQLRVVSNAAQESYNEPIKGGGRRRAPGSIATAGAGRPTDQGLIKRPWPNGGM